MSTIELIDPRMPNDGPASASAEPLHDGSQDVVSLLGFVPLAGPPVVFLAVPLLLFGLLITGPALLLLTFVVVLLAFVALIVLVGVAVASPFLLVRRLARQRRSRTPRSAPAFVPVGTREELA